MTAGYRFRQSVRDCVALTSALWHWLRLGYYSTALRHVGHNHPDAALLTICCLESQRVVDQFLEGR